MPIDLRNESVLSLAEAAASLPKLDGRRPHVSSLWRWCRKGLRGVRLEYVRIGQRLCTSAEALDRFANALAEADRLSRVSECGSVSDPTHSHPRSARRREREVARARGRLAKVGIR